MGSIAIIREFHPTGVMTLGNSYVNAKQAAGALIEAKWTRTENPGWWKHQNGTRAIIDEIRVLDIPYLEEYE